MSVAAATDPIDPPPAGDVQPSRFGRLLNLVRRLIDYGRDLAASLQQPSAPEGLPDISRIFGTHDIARVLARIAQGIQRATALQARLEPLASRPDTPPRSRPSAARQSTAPAARASAPADVTPLHLPTAQEIADSVRRRPIGAVIADICHDLGITPTHPLWEEVQRAMLMYGGNLGKFFMQMIERSFQPLIEAWPSTWESRSPASAATGPP